MAPYKPAQPSLSTTMTVHPSPPNPLDRAWGGKARARWRRKAISEELLPPQPRDALAGNHGVIYRSIPAPNEKVLALKVGWPVDTDTACSRAPQGLPAVLASRPPSRPTSNLLGPLKPQPNSVSAKLTHPPNPRAAATVQTDRLEIQGAPPSAAGLNVGGGVSPRACLSNILPVRHGDNAPAG